MAAHMVIIARRRSGFLCLLSQAVLRNTRQPGKTARFYFKAMSDVSSGSSGDSIRSFSDSDTESSSASESSDPQRKRQRITEEEAKELLERVERKQGK